jgi:hypothetical protein
VLIRSLLFRTAARNDTEVIYDKQGIDISFIFYYKSQEENNTVMTKSVEYSSTKTACNKVRMRTEYISVTLTNITTSNSTNLCT